MAARRSYLVIASVLILSTAVVGAWTLRADDSSGPGFGTITPEVAATAAALRDRALGDARAWSFVEGLTVEVGPRFAGTAADRRAVEWARTTLESWQLDNVRSEPVTVPRWQRGDAAGEILAPYPQPVVLVALGGSVGTPEQGIDAEVLRVGSLAELDALADEGAAGKIVFVDERMQRSRDGRGYGAAVAKRVAGASLAAKKGAAALLIRSAGTSSSRIAHTGTMRYEDGVRRIPAAALSNADADLLAAQIARGKTARFRLRLGARDAGEAESANVIAEVIGREKPDEIIVLAAHLDSWDVGTGAVDDGAGCAIMAAAAKLIAELPRRPRRTIRVLLTANEEFGLSGALAYGERYADAMDQHVAGLEADFGSGRVWVMRSGLDAAASPHATGFAEDAARLLAPLGIELEDGPAFGGADLRPLRQAGVPVFDLSQDGSLYFDVHHTIDDTLDKVDPEALAQNVAAYATLAYLIADFAGDLGRAQVPPPPRR